ncbi:MAG TPA: HD domain-containing protein [Candidatus Saccharimonadales bacterium]|nr:HD domain-containing protein [Candidatus Saccharimonadales bacterium]
MNVLFVCSGNIGRSQMAMEYFKRLGVGKTASAGTRVTVENEKIGDREDAQNVLEVMREDGIEMSSNRRTTLVPEMLADFDKAIVMAEPDRTPEWLSSSPKFEYWEIPNVNGMPIEQLRKVRDAIKSKVRDLATLATQSQDKITAFRQHVVAAAGNLNFVHHKWFVPWHLEIVEKLADELCDYYPDADKELINVMVWMHDYGKILDFDDQYQKTLVAGRAKLQELGFATEFTDRVITYIEALDKKLEIDLRAAPIEVQIVSSADGCSHMVGPFLEIFWHEATDKTFTNKTFKELMDLNRKKVDKDWNYKIVLPEARRAFEARYIFHREQSGELPEKFF